MRIITRLNSLLAAILPESLYARHVAHWNPSGVKKHLANTGWALIARFGNLIISFFVTIYVVRYLGPSAYGELSYAVSFIGIFSILGSLGIDTILYRELVQYPEKRNVYLGSAFTIKLVAGAVAGIIAATSAWLFSPVDVSRLVIFILATTFIFNAFNVIIYEFQAHVAQKYPSLISLGVVCILNALKLAVIFLDGGVLYLAVVLCIEAILYAIGFTYIRTKHYGSIREWRYDTSTAVRILHDSWPFIFVAVFTSIYARIDQVMLKHMIDSSAVGLYDAAVRIAEAWLFIPGIIASSLFPAIMSAKKTSVHEYKKRLLTLAILLGSIAILVALITSLLATPIITLIYGYAFSGSATVFAIYIWSGVGASLNSVVQYFLIAEHRRQVIFYTSLGTMLLNIGLNLLLIPHYGIAGAAWATCISYTLLAAPLILIARIK